MRSCAFSTSVLVASVGLAMLGSCNGFLGGGGTTTEGERLFRTARVNDDGVSRSCAQCHGDDGSGGPDPDIRGSSSSHLESHAQGDGAHPEGVKFPDLTHEDFEAIAEFLGGSGGDDHDEDDIDSLVGDAGNGEELFNSPQPTLDGVDLSCGSCHRQDGAGAAGPTVRGQSAGHLREHAQGDGDHPEGIKFPQLSDQDFADMAAFLADGEAHE